VLTPALRIGTCVAASLLAARCAWELGPGPALAAAVLAGMYAEVLVGAREARIGHLALALSPPFAFALSGSRSLGLQNYDAAFVAQEAGQKPLLALRVGVLVLFVVLVPPKGRTNLLALALVGCLFVLSLVARGALLAYVLAAAVTARFASPATAPSVRTPAAWTLIGLALLGLVPLPVDRSEPTSSDPPQLVASWRRRGNLFQARWWAMRWATTEPVPGDGHLALGEIDWKLGHRIQAWHVLDKVFARPASDDVLRRAEQLSAAWKHDDAPPAGP
jgi:hypothetical protein